MVPDQRQTCDSSAIPDSIFPAAVPTNPITIIVETGSPVAWVAVNGNRQLS